MKATTVRLIAQREIRERGRARSYRITFVFSVLLVVLGVLLPKALSSPTKAVHLGVVGAAPTGLSTNLSKIIDHQVIVTSIADTATAKADLLNGTLDVAIDGDQVLVKQVPKTSDTTAKARLADAVAAEVGEQVAFRTAHLTPAQAQALATIKPVTITGLKPATPDRTRQKIVTQLGIVVMYSLIALFGTWVLYGVVEEKSSRVVEILLATVETTELLAGKIMGIGALVLAQAVAILVAAYATERASGSDVLKGSTGGQVFALIGWFLLGYAFYSALFAAGGSLVGRMEEAQNASFPISLPLLISYFFVVGGLAGGTASKFEVVLSFLPPTAMVAMPGRVALGPVPAWEIGLSVALVLVGIVAAVRFAAVVYDRAILHTGSRLTWRTALRSERA